MTAAAKEVCSVVTSGQPVSLSDKPEIGTIKLYSAAGEETAFTADYIEGTVVADGLNDGDQFLATYRYSATQSMIESAIREVGRRISLRTVASLTFVDGIAELPDGFVSLEWFKKTTEDIDLFADSEECVNTGDCYQCDSCRIFIRGDKIVLNPAPAIDVDAQICYNGNYVIAEDGSIAGLTREHGDLVILKALSLSYGQLGNSSVFTSPLSRSAAQESTNPDREDGLIETQFRVGDEWNQKKWEGGTDIADFIKTQSGSFTELSNYYEKMFEQRLLMIDGIAKQSVLRNGYRRRIGK